MSSTLPVVDEQTAQKLKKNKTIIIISKKRSPVYVLLHYRLYLLHFQSANNIITYYIIGKMLLRYWLNVSVCVYWLYVIMLFLTLLPCPKIQVGINTNLVSVSGSDTHTTNTPVSAQGVNELNQHAWTPLARSWKYQKKSCLLHSIFFLYILWLPFDFLLKIQKQIHRWIKNTLSNFPF